MICAPVRFTASSLAENGGKAESSQIDSYWKNIIDAYSEDDARRNAPEAPHAADSLERGRRLLERGAVAEAVTALREAILRLPDSPEAHLCARAALTRAIELQARSPAAAYPHYADGAALREQGDVEKALYQERNFLGSCSFASRRSTSCTHINLGNPDVRIDQPTAGRITSRSGSHGNLQFGLRLTY